MFFKLHFALLFHNFKTEMTFLKIVKETLVITSLENMQHQYSYIVFHVRV